MILQALFPIFSLIIAGGLLKRFRIIDDAFLKQSDRLVYYVLFPVLLFWKIGGAQTAAPMGFQMPLACGLAVFSAFLLSVILAWIFSPSSFSSGAFTQCCYRNNTYIGLALALTAYGEEGLRIFGILAGFVIVLANLLAVTSLIWYSRDRLEEKNQAGMVLRAVFSNPLILSCLAGVVYSQAFSGFPPFLENSFKLIGSAALPLALVSMGGALFAAKLAGRSILLVLAVAVKLIAAPAFGFYF